MTPRRWYATRAAAERAWMLVGERGVSLVESGALTVGLRFYECVESFPLTGEFGTRTVRTTFVATNGGFMRHVDRLARDWIGHGVAPCADGRRGVGAPSACSCRPWMVQRWDRSRGSYREERHDLDCTNVRWGCAEARARRVVAR